VPRFSIRKWKPDWFGVFLIPLIALSLTGQGSAQSSNLLNAARQAFNPGADVHSVHLSGTASLVVGTTTHSGPMDFTASSNGQSELTLTLDSGQWTEQWDAISAERTCTRTDSTGSHAMTLPECWSAVSWVFPQLALQTATLPQQVSFVQSSSTSESLNISTSVPELGTNLGTLIHNWTSSTLNFDPATGRISTLSYQIFPDSGEQIPIEVTVSYTNYQSVGSVVVPYQIQRSINGNAILTLTVSSAQTN
jgi:hypothetical protein